MLKGTPLPGVGMYFISNFWKRDEFFFFFSRKRYFNQWVQWEEISYFLTFSACVMFFQIFYNEAKYWPPLYMVVGQSTYMSSFVKTTKYTLKCTAYFFLTPVSYWIHMPTLAIFCGLHSSYTALVYKSYAISLLLSLKIQGSTLLVNSCVKVVKNSPLSLA